MQKNEYHVNYECNNTKNIASKGERVHRVYMRHLIQEMNLCCRLFVKQNSLETMRRQSIRLRGKIALHCHYIIHNKSHSTAAAINLQFDGTCRV